jgi:hypothetical protein
LLHHPIPAPGRLHHPVPCAPSCPDPLPAQAGCWHLPVAGGGRRRGPFAWCWAHTHTHTLHVVVTIQHTRVSARFPPWKHCHQQSYLPEAVPPACQYLQLPAWRHTRMTTLSWVLGPSMPSWQGLGLLCWHPTVMFPSSPTPLLLFRASIGRCWRVFITCWHPYHLYHHRPYPSCCPTWHNSCLRQPLYLAPLSRVSDRIKVKTPYLQVF